VLITGIRFLFSFSHLRGGPTSKQRQSIVTNTAALFRQKRNGLVSIRLVDVTLKFKKIRDRHIVAKFAKSDWKGGKQLAKSGSILPKADHGQGPICAQILVHIHARVASCNNQLHTNINIVIALPRTAGPQLDHSKNPKARTKLSSVYCIG
jgi:hypothetical protein